MSTLHTRLKRLELSSAPAPNRPPRTFSTFDGMTFAEIIAGDPADYRHAIIGANGEWPAGAHTITQDDLAVIKREGEVLVIAWGEQAHG